MEGVDKFVRIKNLKRKGWTQSSLGPPCLKCAENNWTHGRTCRGQKQTKGPNVWTTVEGKRFRWKTPNARSNHWLVAGLRQTKQIECRTCDEISQPKFSTRLQLRQLARPNQTQIYDCTSPSWDPWPWSFQISQFQSRICLQHWPSSHPSRR